MQISLPIDELLPSLGETVLNNPITLLKATPGAGKTTRIPPYLGQLFEKKILVLEPRRIAARLSAERIASERNEPCGNFVGFHVRFDKNFTEKTKVIFVTEGMLLKYLLSSPLLSEFSCIILDEFHERNIHSDFAYALIKHLQATLRPELRLLLMSATLNLSDLQNLIPEAKTVESTGRVYPVNIIYKDPNSRLSLSQNTADAIRDLFFQTTCTQHLLAFLPGANDIKKTAAELANFAQKNQALICELRGELPFSEQQKAFSEHGAYRKIILATNVAETSVTINNVTGVVDCGLAKIASFASWSGLPTLDIKAISKSACEQRAGRAGRTTSGTAIRLFSKYDFDIRANTSTPEILRTELSQALLDFFTIKSNYTDNFFPPFDNLPWIDKPPAKNIESGLDLLKKINAVNALGKLTSTGQEMASFSLHPRLSRIIVEAKKQNIFELGIVAAGLLSEGMLLKRQNRSDEIGDSDLEYQIDLYLSLQKNKHINYETTKTIDITKLRRIESFIKIFVKNFNITKINLVDNYDKLSLCLLKAFPDRVGLLLKQKKGDNLEYNLCGEGSALLDTGSIVHNAKYIIAIDTEEQSFLKNSSTNKKIIIAHKIKEELLLEDSAEMLQEITDTLWDNETKKVIASQKIKYGALVIDETLITGTNSACETLLLNALKKDWRAVFTDYEYIEHLDSRIKFCSDNGLAIDFLLQTPEKFNSLLQFICSNKKSYSQIKEKSLTTYTAEFLDYKILEKIEKFAPEKITIAKGKSVIINYQLDTPPWIASRMQDFFGCSETPKIFNQKIPLVVHLLAPNKQALQVTKDLKSFWATAYPTLKKEYARRYPRHYWPDNPLEAEPPESNKLRPKLI